MIEYKVGQKVKLKEDLINAFETCQITLGNEMLKYAGEKVTIQSLNIENSLRDGYTRVRFEEIGFFWTTKAIEERTAKEIKEEKLLQEKMLLSISKNKVINVKKKEESYHNPFKEYGVIE